MWPWATIRRCLLSRHFLKRGSGEKRGRKGLIEEQEERKNKRRWIYGGIAQPRSHLLKERMKARSVLVLAERMAVNFSAWEREVVRMNIKSGGPSQRFERGDPASWVLLPGHTWVWDPVPRKGPRLHPAFVHVSSHGECTIKAEVEKPATYIQDTDLNFDPTSKMPRLPTATEIRLTNITARQTSCTTSVLGGFNELRNSSNSFSMFPSKPKIFHGREEELICVLELLNEKSPRIAILGGGGMGKTSLARAALHHPNTISKFEHRFFVGAEAATTNIELAALVGLHPGLNPGQDLTKAVVQYFARTSPSLLILDNLETVWEPIQTRAGVENLLSLLSKVEHLALMVDQLLQFTGNMPLAVDLIAHLADYEGLPNVLSRWESEKTSMLSPTHHGWEQGIIEPPLNGLSDVELVDAHLGIANIRSCKTVLQATSLAYQDSNKRLLLLMPIREYIKRILPPSQSHIQLLQSHFYALLNLYRKYSGQPQLQPVVNQITLNLVNLDEVLKRGLYPNASTVTETIYCVLSLNSFHRVTGRDPTPLMNDIQGLLPELCDHKLEIWFLLEVLLSRPDRTLVSQEALARVMGFADRADDPFLQAKFHMAAGFYFFINKVDSQKATQFLQHALLLSKQYGDINQQCDVFSTMAREENHGGLHSAGLNHASIARKLAKLSGNLYGEAQANLIGANCSINLGEYQESAAQLQRARQLLCLCGMSGGRLDHGIMVSQAEIHLLKSEYAQSRRINNSIVKTASPQENPFSYALALVNIAQIDVIIGGASQEVCHNLHTARTIFRNDNSPVALSLCDTIQANLELRDGKFTTARDQFEKCLRFSWGNDNQVEGFCLGQLAHIKLWPVSRWQEKWPIIYLSFACKFKDKLALHQALLFLGDIFIINNNEHMATNLYQVALDGFTQMDVHYSRAQCMVRLGDLAHQKGCTSEAITFWKAARPLFVRSSQSKDATEMDSKLASIEPAYHKNLMILGTLNAPVHFVTETSEAENSGVLEPDNFQGYELLLTRQTKALPCRSKLDNSAGSVGDKSQTDIANRRLGVEHTIPPVLTALVAGAIAVQGLQTCDSAEYDPSQYTCFNISLLCPIVKGVKYQACGEDC
ncbi:hypothetical protein K438DRAFT_1785475 [Mycena galopus ATCC 62051]|nr:hypothetical protein K438DRAFT_1785475 [Mycena galopus ATCC 62051]